MKEWIVQHHFGEDRVDFHFDKNTISAPQRFGDIYVYQIGRLYCTKRQVIAEHMHERWFELTILTEGCCTISAGGKRCRLNAGEIFLSFPNETHGMETDAGQDVKYDFWAFYPADSETEAQLCRITRDFMRPELRVFSDERINSLIGIAISETNEAARYTGEILAAVYKQIVCYILRVFDGIRGRNTVGASLAQSQCFRAMSYIDSHLGSLAGLSEVSAALGYNYSYFSRLFRRITGVTLSDYYNMRRLDSARFLIVEGELSVTQIADKLRYSSVYAFSKAFKNKFGCSPRNYVSQSGKSG